MTKDNRKFNEQELVRRKKRDELILKNQNPYDITKFKITYNSKTFSNNFFEYKKDELHIFDNKIISMAGRIKTIRISGKAIFMNIQDFEGVFQIYLRADSFSFEEFEQIKNYDLGDIIGVNGNPMKTNVGTLTLKTKKIILLTKSLKPLPNKFHGLTNVEDKYRQRYIDLIVNDESKNVFLKRIKIINYMRDFLNKKGFLEVETPILHYVFGGAAAKPFKTFHNSLNEELYLRIATEIQLKKLIVGGLEKVYEIGRIFRNEGISIKHNPEFTSIELYEAYKDMYDIMNLTEDMLIYILKKLYDKTIIFYGKEKLSFKKPWTRIHMVDAIKQYTKINFWEEISFEEAKKLAKKHNVEIKNHYFDVGHIINAFFEKFVEEKLKNPTFVYGHPKVISPFAKTNKKDKRFTERFELFILGREYGNAFSELNDPDEQYKRFLDQLKEKKSGNDEANEIDYDFINALEYGMPPTGGLGIGIDRLVMLFTNQPSIRDVLFFPHLKSK